MRERKERGRKMERGGGEGIEAENEHRNRMNQSDRENRFDKEGR